MKKIALILLISLTSFACNNIASNFIEIETNYGKFTVELFDETPLHRDNFIKLVTDGYYDDLLFHRVVHGFMVQAGDPESKNAPYGKVLGEGGPGYTIPAELNASERCFHHKGALAAARLSDEVNPEKASSGSQFYIVLGHKCGKGELAQFDKQRMRNAYRVRLKQLNDEEMDSLNMLMDTEGHKAYKALLSRIKEKAKAETIANADSITMPDSQKQTYMEIGGTPHLDGEYTVFGQVIRGMEVIENIANTETDSHARPIKDVKIISAKFVSE